ncbi:hypothetical protein PCANC_15454 [Puccinia coronata f. sp. avenae]|uniref:Uncharacterized protein n=1 Tax=Puccinia coronata f. sp. avenae TaxID=200324 RepID=A0A2N5UHZ1_9BASI|nr:hypothetical protein PCANC_22484 [Puccinia coronata f. sp. avenae]PLW14125.1 hypothetical protein PCASD_22003 [Puccinia coronata f. sp. avenae]PLW37306.1 hypothetical protein PCANC_15454 [Puccinia coronata f. sp. avenae]
MLGGLCAKVNYEYDGCDGFKPLDKTPGENGNPVGSLSAPQEYDDSLDASENPSKPKHAKHHKKPKHSGDDTNNSLGAQSFNDAGADVPSGPTSDAEASSPSSHHKKPKKQHGKYKDGSTGALSFNEADDNDEPQKHHPSTSSAFGAEDGGDSDQCNSNEYYSSQLEKCVNKSFFSSANDNSTCKNGKLDAVLKLCLDVSLLGLAKPIHAEASVLPFGPGHNGEDGCPAGQQLSSLLNVCVDQKFFADALGDNQCAHGWKLDLVLGICLDLVGCQNQDQ